MMAGRTCSAIFLTCLHLLAHSAGQDTEKVKWQGDLPEIIKEGRTVVLTCVGQELGTIDGITVLRTVDGIPSAIVNNQVVTSEFASLKRPNGQPRYAGNYDLEQDTKIGTLTLTISEIRGEDSGLLECKSSVPNSNSDYLMLNVEVPVSEVYVTQMLPNMTVVPVQSGSTLLMKHMTAGGFACNAKVVGSTVLPIVKAYINGEEHSTKFGQYKENVTEINTLRQGSTFMYNFERIASLEDFVMNPDYRYHGATLRCEGYSRGYPSIKKSATANLAVEFAPIMQCGRFAYYAEVGESVTFSCSVLGNPPPSISIHFGVNGDENKHEFQGYEQDGDFIYERENSPGNSTVKFTISPVDAGNFNAMYKIIASNTYNEGNPVETMLELYQGKDPLAPTSSCTQEMASFIVLLLPTLAFFL